MSKARAASASNRLASMTAVSNAVTADGIALTFAFPSCESVGSSDRPPSSSQGWPKPGAIRLEGPPECKAQLDSTRNVPCRSRSASESHSKASSPSQARKRNTTCRRAFRADGISAEGKSRSQHSALLVQLPPRSKSLRNKTPTDFEGGGPSFKLPLSTSKRPPSLTFQVSGPRLIVYCSPTWRSWDPLLPSDRQVC